MDPLPQFLTGLMATCFAAVHLYIGRLTRLETVPRNGWLSFAGGIAVAYVFLHILPELGAHSQTFADALNADPLQAEVAVYSLSLLGLGVFYALERAVKLSRAKSQAEDGRDRIGADLLWVHIGSFSALNLMIGYLLLHREDASLGGLALYFVAMSLHFATADFGMRSDHREAYDRIGRWVIAAAVLLGWLIGVWLKLPEVAIGGAFAFVAGGVVLNVMKEELPEDRQSRFGPFAAGVALYAVLVFGETLI